MMDRFAARAVPVVFGFAALAALPLRAEPIHANPNGYNEVPTLSSPARGEFNARINKDETEITYELSYSGFPSSVTQAHIHLGRRAVNGGVMVFLCANAPVVPPAGTPTCPLNAGTVTGTLNAASVVGPTAQGIAPAEFAEVIQAIRVGAAYVNIHSTAFPGGEIRDQVSSPFLIRFLQQLE
jgi:hypothetical protein